MHRQLPSLRLSLSDAFLLCVRRPAWVEYVSVVVIGDDGAHEKRRSVDGQQQLSQHFSFFFFSFASFLLFFSGSLSTLCRSVCQCAMMDRRHDAAFCWKVVSVRPAALGQPHTNPVANTALEAASRTRRYWESEEKYFRSQHLGLVFLRIWR